MLLQLLGQVQCPVALGHPILYPNGLINLKVLKDSIVEIFWIRFFGPAACLHQQRQNITQQAEALNCKPSCRSANPFVFQEMSQHWKQT